MSRRILLASIAALAGAVAAAVFVVERDPDPRATEAAALFDGYCVDCHNAIDRAGELSLDDKDLGHVGHDPEAWEAVVRKLKTGMMPPPGERRPDRETLDALAAELESRLDRAAEATPMLSRIGLRRLNRTEYANAIRDLLHLDVDASTLLPLDDSAEGFDNIATALGVSPSLIQAYVSAAMKISRRALGDPNAPRTQVTYAAPERLKQDRHLAGLPLGTRGGLSIEHEFPLDAEYQFRIRRGFRSFGTARLDVTLDGVPVTVEDPASFRLAVSAGPHTLTVAVVDLRRPGGVDDIYAEYASPGGIRGVEIDGPIDPTGVGETPSRRRILTCRPETPEQEAPCAREIVSTLATRAFRRPVSREELDPLLDFYAAGREAGGFEHGLEQALSRILVDPRFLYRVEKDPPALAAGATYEIDDFELATRLSFFVWSSIPDDELLETAASGRLGEPDVLAGELGRMLADPKAAALTDNFAAQWLRLRELESVTPNADAFDENLRRSMIEETKELFGAVVSDDMSVVRLLDADFTFVDERLAEHYGIPGVHGSHFRSVELPADNPRRGLLGQASILTLTSVTNRTSPVIRGNWVLETLLGAPAPVPPPNVNTTLEGDDGAPVPTSVRERLEAHRRDPTCASCHAIMDPVGFALENFDLIGAWRETDGGEPIDARGTLADGTPVDGPAALRAALLARSDAFVTTLTEKLLTYALGRSLEYYDMPAVRGIVRAAEAENYRFSALARGVVESTAFRMQVKGATD